MTTLEDVMNDIDVISNAYIVRKPQQKVLHTSTIDTALATPIFTKTNMSTSPMLLHSLPVFPDSTFATYYKYMVTLEGLNIDNNSMDYVSSTGGEDYVPTGKKYLIPAGATLKFFAYNAGALDGTSTSTDAYVSVLAIFQKLDTLIQ